MAAAELHYTQLTKLNNRPRIQWQSRIRSLPRPPTTLPHPEMMVSLCREEEESLRKLYICTFMKPENTEVSE